MAIFGEIYQKKFAKQTTAGLLFVFVLSDHAMRSEKALAIFKQR